MANWLPDSTPITTAWLVSLGFTKIGDWLQIETLPGIYLAWDGEELRLESVMIPGPQTRQRVYDIFAALGLEPPSESGLTEAWLLSRGGQRTAYGVMIELVPSLFMTWNDAVQILWIGGINIPGPHTRERVLAIMNAFACQPQAFHSYYNNSDGIVWACIGISEPVTVLPSTRLYMARLSADDAIGIFSPNQNGDPLVHADSVWSGTLVILRRGNEYTAWPLEKFRKHFTHKG